MKFMLSVIDSATGSATGDEMLAIDAFNERLVAADFWITAAGLGHPSAATTIDNRDGVGLVSEAPYVTTRDYVAGFWIIDVPDHATAIALASDGSRACHRRVEVRPFL
jgi:hypothetical protein